VNQVFKGEKGSALITVLIVMGVLTVLGAALLHYSLTDNLQVINDEKRMQAHYLARSGAEAVADYIMKNPDGVDELLGKKTESVELGEGTFQVEVTKRDNGELLIESTGDS
jgi:type II secretory pathway component PulK